jgi:hypothetical protein
MLGRVLDTRFVDYNTALLFARNETDTLVVLGPGESAASEALSQHAQALPEEMIWLREETGAYRLFWLPAGYAPQPPPPPGGTPAQLENGVSLLGYHLSPLIPGQTARLTLYWRVDAVPDDPPPQGFSFAIHVLGADGQRCGQGDRPSYHVQRWRAGDAFASWFDIPMDASAPPAPYTLNLGMYVYTPPDQFQGVSVVGPDGQPIAESVKWTVE